MTRYDVIVIGVGMAGVNAARRLASAGKNVAVVDARPYGGTCALRGCDPKKVLLGAAELLDWQRRMAGHGVTGDLRIDWGELMAFKRTFTEPVPGSIEKGLQKAGVATHHGEARFVAKNRLVIGEDEFQADHVLIAAGAKPRDLGIPGADLLATSSEFLELDALPERVAFVGGGYVSFEFAHLAARAGAEVTLFHRDEQPLEAFDPDLVAQLVDATRELGIDVRLSTEVTAVERADDALNIRTSDGTIAADLAVHGAGRVPELDALDLAAADVEVDPERGVLVTEHLQSVSNPAVYAAGDAAATSGWPLTPVAVHEGMIAASNILKGNQRTPDYAGTPSVAFTIPALARAGLSEEEAEAQGRSVRVERGDMSGWYTARRTRERCAAYKVLIDEETGQIVGAHLLGMHAADQIDMFALAIRHGLTAHEVKTGIFVHPAAASDVSYML